MRNIGHQRMHRILIEWGIFFVAMIVLHGAYFGVWMIVDLIAPRSIPPLIGLTILYLIAFTVVMIVFYRRLSDAHLPRVYRDARKIGVPATATVLDTMKTGIESGANRSASFTNARHHYEIQMRLRVSRPDQPDYETEIAEFFKGREIPKEGDTLAVKVHPQKPEVVVIAPQ